MGLFSIITEKVASVFTTKVVLSTLAVMMCASVAPIYELIAHSATEERVKSEREMSMGRKLLLQLLFACFVASIHVFLILDGTVSMFMSTAVCGSVAVLGYEGFMTVRGKLVSKLMKTADDVDLSKGLSSLPGVKDFIDTDKKSDKIE